MARNSELLPNRVERSRCEIYNLTHATKAEWKFCEANFDCSQWYRPHRNLLMKIKRAHKSVSLVLERSQKEAHLTAVARIRESAVNIKKILVPMDFSDCSQKALEYAIPFAMQFGAKLILLHVVEPYVPMPDVTTVDWGVIDAQLRESAQEQLKRLRQSLGKEVKSEAEFRFGRPEFEIVQLAKELDIDLIILSTHGRTGLAHAFLGSTTERVVRHAGCPVLVVREREHDFVGRPATEKPAQAVRRATKRAPRS